MKKEDLKVVSLTRNANVEELLKTVLDVLKDETETPTAAVVVVAYDTKDGEGLDTFSTNMPFSRQIGLLEAAKINCFIETE